MADIIATRVDYRLVHGQVATKWVKILNISKIIIIDDETAQDDFQKELLKLAAPAGVKVLVYTLDRALERWQEKKFGVGRVLVLFKYVQTAHDAYLRGFEYKDLVLGQVPGASDRKIAYKSVNLSNAELDVVKEIADRGVRVVLQMVPDEKPAAFQPVYDRLKAEFAGA